MDWDNYRAFLEVYRSGDLGNAARESEMSVPTVRRRLDAVESEIGFALFERTSRGLSPTPVARRLVRTIAAMGESAAGVRTLREAANHEVTVASGEAIAGAFLVPVWSKVRQSHSGSSVKLLIRRRQADLFATNADIILSHALPPSPDLAAWNCGSLEIGLFAHQDYLARVGAPRAAVDLEHFNMIGAESEGVDRLLQSTFDLPSGAARRAFKTDSVVAQLGAIRAGLGIGVFYADLAARDANLVRVLPEAAACLDCWVWSPRPEGLDEALRPVFDALVSTMTACARPALDMSVGGDVGLALKPIAA